MRFLRGGGPPRNPSRSFPPYPRDSRFFPPPVPRPPLCATHPPDLKYIDTLTHTRMNEQLRTGLTESHTLFASPTEYYPTDETVPFLPSFPTLSQPYISSAYSSTRFDIFRELRPARTSRKSILR